MLKLLWEIAFRCGIRICMPHFQLIILIFFAISNWVCLLFHLQFKIQSETWWSKMACFTFFILYNSYLYISSPAVHPVLLWLIDSPLFFIFCTLSLNLPLSSFTHVTLYIRASWRILPSHSPSWSYSSSIWFNLSVKWSWLQIGGCSL